MTLSCAVVSHCSHPLTNWLLIMWQKTLKILWSRCCKKRRQMWHHEIRWLTWSCCCWPWVTARRLWGEPEVSCPGLEYWEDKQKANPCKRSIMWSKDQWAHPFRKGKFTVRTCFYLKQRIKCEKRLTLKLESTLRRVQRSSVAPGVHVGMTSKHLRHRGWIST